MRRPFAAAVALVALSGTAHSAPAPQLRDKPGDWTVASQDIVSGRVSSTRAGKKLFLRGELRLAAAPGATVPTTYNFGFAVNDCHRYAFVYTWRGDAGESEAFLEHTDHCRVRYVWELPGEDRYPVEVGVRGSTITWQTPYVGAIRKGARADMFHAYACTNVCGVQVKRVPAEPSVLVGDDAWTDGWYVVGSDLPRR